MCVNDDFSYLIERKMDVIGASSRSLARFYLFYESCIGGRKSINNTNSVILYKHSQIYVTCTEVIMHVICVHYSCAFFHISFVVFYVGRDKDEKVQEPVI